MCDLVYSVHCFNSRSNCFIVCRMATNESGVTSLTAAATTVPTVLKRNSDDVGWEYGVLVDPLNTSGLQRMAVRILSLTSSSSGRERN
jgi:hypothetical protein